MEIQVCIQTTCPSEGLQLAATKRLNNMSFFLSGSDSGNGFPLNPDGRPYSTSDVSLVGTLTSNGRLLNVHIGPVYVLNGRSMDIQWTYQMRHNSSVQIGLKWTSILDLQEMPCTVPGRPLGPHQTSTRCLLDADQISYLTGMVSGVLLDLHQTLYWMNIVKYQVSVISGQSFKNIDEQS